MDIESLKVEHQIGSPQWNRLQSAVQQQLGELLSQHAIVLGVPLEGRIKTWESIHEKIERKELALSKITELDDLVGVRGILLFHSDLARADALIQSTFEVVKREDTGTRLSDAQFGYQSRHYVVRLPQAWLAMPSLRDLGTFSVELQIRTLSQHVWAAASHKLQYKHEESVPPPLRRTINRISALLETVDLEFDRVLEERTKYLDSSAKLKNDSEKLNVDNLATLLNSILSTESKSTSERYEDLLIDLSQHKIRTIAQLKTLWQKHGEDVLKTDVRDVKRRAAARDYQGTSKERIERGVFRTHVGLVRRALRTEFGDEKLTLARKTRPETKASTRRKGT